jgi:hypothetical protein
MTKAITALALCSCTFVAFAGTEVSHTRFQDETARVDYSWNELAPGVLPGAEPCIIGKILTVTAARTKVKADGSTQNTPSLSVLYTTSNLCDAAAGSVTWLSESDNATLQIDSNLRYARLIASAVVLRGTRVVIGQNGILVKTDVGTITVSIDMGWVSDDPIDKYAGTIVTQRPGYQEVHHLIGLYRLASAAGVISDGASNWLPAEPQGLVQLFRLSQGETILTKE